MADYHDMVIADLADSEAELLVRVRELAADCEAYRLLAQQAIHVLHDLTRSHDRLREKHALVLAEYRALREQTMLRDARAA